MLIGVCVYAAAKISDFTDWALQRQAGHSTAPRGGRSTFGTM
jgi:hypothetical protein